VKTVLAGLEFDFKEFTLDLEDQKKKNPCCLFLAL